MKLKEKKVLVFGTGLSGIAAAELLWQSGAYPVLFDGNKEIKEADVRVKLQKDCEAEVIIGELTEEVIASLIWWY